MKQKIIIGNWKMHGTHEKASIYLDALLAKLPLQEEKKVMLAVPFTLLSSMANRVRNSCVQIGAQNIHEEEEGAFTGEVSCHMVRDAGAQFVIIGHSERRTLFGETGEKIRRKVQRALAVGIQPVVCIGETLLEREQGQVKDVLEKQLQEAVKDLSIDGIIFAYEPVWAIGTGLQASAQVAEDAHKLCRDFLRKQFGEIASFVPILYGGSVKKDNVANFLAKDDIDGVLVGGASLDPESFLQIIQSS
jgi:triosephosphate isomerase (TIM)